ncbi:hypothetical protein LMG27174_02196 [Paraburkholderia rhynchosiae]|uniref:Uncharacterized protein n=1 Tax=Paraburkholderia rhynchosiae TaxID=487049 RepID=A0A6J5AR44_9BURK|nr:hypothetical protein LMG27174_02196 [Paraburkholderia rhynchosiae]
MAPVAQVPDMNAAPHGAAGMDEASSDDMEAGPGPGVTQH